MTIIETDLVHERGKPDDDGHDRCGGCLYRWPCPTIRQQPEALMPGGEVLADEVGVGWAIWERTPPGSAYVPRGGIVVEVREEAGPEHEGVDPSLLGEGDIVRVFRAIAFFRGEVVVHELRTGDFDPLLSNPPNSASIRNTARKLCEIVSKKKGTVSPFEYGLAEHALRLYRAVA